MTTILPGCPPPVDLINKALDAILNGDLPPKGSVLAPLPAVCDECPRKRENKKITTIHRVYEIVPEPERCLMEQGIICMGMATRSGCGAQCLKVDMPCTGCGGATPNQSDIGTGMMTALASILNLDKEPGTYTEEEVMELISQIKDPAGIFYMYSLPSSILQKEGDERMKEITIDPITRLEGHGSVSIFLNDKGEVENAYLKIPELRGFESFCVGRPAELMPILDDAHLRRVPGGASLRLREGFGRGVPCEPAVRRQEAAGAAVHGLHLLRPHTALLLPGRTGLHRRSGRARRRSATSWA